MLKYLDDRADKYELNKFSDRVSIMEKEMGNLHLENKLTNENVGLNTFESSLKSYLDETKKHHNII